MIENFIKNKKISADLSEQEINDIKLFIKGAVYGFCNNCKEADGKSCWFSVFTLFGKDNYYWEKPLINIYNYHIANGKDIKTAVLLSGQDLGHLLKEVLNEDTRKYEMASLQRKFSVNTYRKI